MDVKNIVLEFHFRTSWWLACLASFWGTLSETFDDLRSENKVSLSGCGGQVWGDFEYLLSRQNFVHYLNLNSSVILNIVPKDCLDIFKVVG